MTSALVSNGAVVDFYPYAVPNPVSFVDGNGVSHQVSCADIGWTGDGATAAFAILPAVMDTPPDPTSHPDPNIAQTYAISNGQVQVTRAWITPSPVVFVPRQVTNAQAKCWFLNNNMLTQVQAAVSAIGGTTFIRWEYGNNFERNHPDTIAIIQALGKTDSEADQMFIEASAL